MIHVRHSWGPAVDGKSVCRVCGCIATEKPHRFGLTVTRYEGFWPLVSGAKRYCYDRHSPPPCDANNKAVLK